MPRDGPRLIASLVTESCDQNSPPRYSKVPTVIFILRNTSIVHDLICKVSTVKRHVNSEKKKLIIEAKGGFGGFARLHVASYFGGLSRFGFQSSQNADI